MLLIVCPLQFEATTLRRALRRLRIRDGVVEVVCCGPGASGIERWASRAGLSAGESVILAGVAGSLREELHGGEARIIDQVVSDAGESWTPTLQFRAPATSAMLITSADAIVTQSDDRRALARRTGAHMVDLESVSFARCAQAHGWRWGIGRGISDDLTNRIPKGMERWVTNAGRTRMFAVLAALARRPSLLRDLRCLRDNSKRGLAHAAALLARMSRT